MTTVRTDTASEERRRRWEAASEWPLTFAALIFLGAYAWPILDPDLGADWRQACRVTTWVAWSLFAVDYAVRLALSADRRLFVRENLVDLAVVVLPLLRPLRLLRLVTLLQVLNRHAAHSLRGRVVTYVVGATTLIMFVAALALLDAERDHPEANVDSFGEAMWWAFATVTTVGYGDRYPVTVTGRTIAVGLMLVGIALLGVVTATFASWLLQRVKDIEDESEAATRADIHGLTAEVTALREELRRASAITTEAGAGRTDVNDSVHEPPRG